MQHPAFAAALQGQWKPISLALSQGFDPNARDTQQRTALMYAAYNGHSEVARKLIEAGAAINSADQTGSTALMFASSGPFSKTVSLLLDKGANVNAVDDNEHFTALMWAAAEGQADNVRLLIANGANPNLKDIDGDTAATFASAAGHHEVVKLLESAEEDEDGSRAER